MAAAPPKTPLPPTARRIMFPDAPKSLPRHTTWVEPSQINDSRQRKEKMAAAPPVRRRMFPDAPKSPPRRNTWVGPARQGSVKVTLDELIESQSPTIIDDHDDAKSHGTYLSRRSEYQRKKSERSGLKRTYSENTLNRSVSSPVYDQPSHETSPKGSSGWGKIKKSFSTASLAAHIANQGSPTRKPVVFRKFASAIYVPEIAREKVAVFNANCQVGASFVRSLAKGGCDVLAVVRVPSSRISRTLYQLDGVSVTVADSLHDRKTLVNTIAGVSRVYIIIKFWEKFDGWEEQQAMTILSACHKNKVPNIVFCTFEDTAVLKHTGERSQIRVDPRKPIRSDGSIRYRAKFEGMKEFNKIAKSLDIRVTHMITSFIDQANSQKSMCLIKGEGKLMAVPHFDVE